MYSAHNDDCLVVRLKAGENVAKNILEACRKHGVFAGFVTSGIGMLKDPEFGYFVAKGEYASRVFDGRFECLSLQGNIAMHDGELMAHLHGICADEEFRAFGGHVVNATVGLTLEVLITDVKAPIKLTRKLENETGLAGLLVE